MVPTSKPAIVPGNFLNNLGPYVVAITVIKATINGTHLHDCQLSSSPFPDKGAI